jgi:aspartate/methionine/tyrosine aminotransferase
MRERTVTISSIGKTFSLTGWKIGWAMAPRPLAEAMRAAHQFVTFAVSTPAQHGAIAAINAPASFYEDLRSAYQARRDLLVQGLRAAGFTVRPPQGTYFACAEIRGLGYSDDVAFCRYLIEKIGVAAIPPSAFYDKSDEGQTYVRFAFCKREETLQAAIERLRRMRGP